MDAHVEGPPDVLGGLALDHAGHLGAGQVQEGLDVHEVGGEDELKQHLLVTGHKGDVPGVQGGGELREVGALEGLLNLGGLLVHVVVQELHHLAQHRDLDGGQGHLVAVSAWERGGGGGGMGGGVGRLGRDGGKE